MYPVLRVTAGRESCPKEEGCPGDDQLYIGLQLSTPKKEKKYIHMYIYILWLVKTPNRHWQQGQNSQNPPGSKRQSFLGNHLQRSQVPPVRQRLNWPKGHQCSMSPRLQGTASFQTNGNKRKQSSPTHTVWAALSQCAMVHAFIINWNPGLDWSFRGNTMSS